MSKNTEYGWFSDIESNPEVIYVEYEHIVSKGIYKVRNVHVQFPPPQPVDISLTGEKIQNEETEPFTCETPNVVSSGIAQFTCETPSVICSGIPHSGTYNITQTHYIDVPHIIYINRQPENIPDDRQPTTDNSLLSFLRYNRCRQTIEYVFVACLIVLICWW
jgi:hypothetical protein